MNECREPVICHSDDSLDAIFAIGGVTSFLSGAILSSDLGVYRTVSGEIFVDPELLRNQPQAALIEAALAGSRGIWVRIARCDAWKGAAPLPLHHDTKTLG